MAAKKDNSEKVKEEVKLQIGAVRLYIIFTTLQIAFLSIKDTYLMNITSFEYTDTHKYDGCNLKIKSQEHWLAL